MIGLRAFHIKQVNKLCGILLPLNLWYAFSLTCRLPGENIIDKWNKFSVNRAIYSEIGKTFTLMTFLILAGIV